MDHFFFDWSLIAFWCCVSFCCKSRWISHMYTHIRSFLNSLPTPPIPLLSAITERCAALLVLHSIPQAHWLTQSPVCMSVLPSIRPTSSFPQCGHRFFLYICISIPALKSVHLYHCSRCYIYALIYDICFSLSDLLHSLWQTHGAL